MFEFKEYDQRIIASIDILGFSEFIDKSTQNENCFNKLKNTFKYLLELKNDNDHGTFSQKDIDKQVTIFSDSIVISYPADLKGSTFYMLQDITHIQLDMMNRGILIRGGVTVGKLIHDDNIVYGPAMVEAHLLESKEAIYPRVLVSKEVLDNGVENAFNNPEEEKKHINSLLREDTDGQNFIDFLSQSDEVDGSEEYYYLLEIVKSTIEKSLVAYKSKDNICKKYEWLNNYYNTVFKKHD